MGVANVDSSAGFYSTNITYLELTPPSSSQGEPFMIEYPPAPNGSNPASTYIIDSGTSTWNLPTPVYEKALSFIADMISAPLNISNATEALNAAQTVTRGAAGNKIFENISL